MTPWQAMQSIPLLDANLHVATGIWNTTRDKAQRAEMMKVIDRLLDQRLAFMKVAFEDIHQPLHGPN